MLFHDFGFKNKNLNKNYLLITIQIANLLLIDKVFQNHHN